LLNCAPVNLVSFRGRRQVPKRFAGDRCARPLFLGMFRTIRRKIQPTKQPW
jgi:hypothetical protein